MFDGGFKSKRAISLGGSKGGATDKQALLRQNQLERNQREREKLRQKSATKIQSFVRSKAALSQQRADERIAFDCWKETKDQDKIGEYGDVDRVARLVQELGERAKWMAPLLNLDTQSEWMNLLPKIINLCVQSARLIDDKQKINILLQFPLLVLQSMSSPIVESTPLLARLPNFLVNRGIFRNLEAFIDSMPTSLPVTYAPFLILTTLLQALPPFLTVMEQATSIMMIPNLPDRMSSSSLVQFLHDFPMRNWIGYLHTQLRTLFLKLDRDIVSQKQSYLLSNLVVLWSKGGMDSGKKELTEMVEFVSVLRRLIDAMPLGYFATVNREVFDDPANDDSDSDNETVREASPNRYSTATPMEDIQKTNSIETLDARTKLNLSILVDGSFLSSFVEATVKMGDSGLMNDVVLLVLTLVYHWPTKKTAILAAVTYGTKLKLMRTVLSSLKSGVVWRAAIGTERSGWGKYLHDPKLAGEWVSIVFLSEVLCHQLQIMSDNEFLGLTDPVSIAEIIAVSSILRNVLFHVFWTAADFSKTETMAKYNSHIIHAFTSLLEQIYSRDSRRQFCPPNHWQMTSELEMESFIQLAIADSDASSIITATSPIRSIKNITNSPRQQILTHIPYVIPFEVRVRIFREWIKRDRESAGLDSEWLRPVARVEIRRDHVFEDAYTKLIGLGAGLKNRVAITFVSSLDGMVEAGIDGGGVFKEFLSELLKEVFADGKHGLFQSTPDNLIYPQTNNRFDALRLRYMEFFGRIIAKALYEGILIDAGFAGFFLSKWLGRQSYLDDLLTLDAELYNGLMFLKNYKGNVEQDLSLNFTATEEGKEPGTQRIVELVPNGANIPVTLENRIKYIYLMANYKLNLRIGVPCRAFFEGLSTLINAKWLRIFNQSELQMLLGGASVPIDLEDLKENITYGGDFHELHPTIKLFWDVVEDDAVFTEEDRRLLVKFVTSCARPPLLGFSELRPGFCIRPSGESEDRLPSASTCVNMLKLPEYRSRSALKEKLLYAIRSGAGFELS
ncbi:hypothetical protein BDR26DRAFT_1007571 [Obelidium mucronatum]|nr:hypothetical protein BDR26DRAFT_1007571 [Obelidium mucronatum]